ncbi:MAG: PEGA domain-containing protein [Verrucomicrobia bacterium]|nr:PEGA domain-containing protein [Verrucomicrobiota bacterium]
MNSISDPSFYLQLSESFIKSARVDGGGKKPRLTALREISSAELASQPNPILQIAGDDSQVPIPVTTTLSLGETVFQSHSFTQVGFSTLTEFVGKAGTNQLSLYELGVFQKENGLPAPTASPTPLELVFCGFNSSAIPELSDAFPNLDSEPTSITLAVLDQFRFLKSQCPNGKQILLVEIANEKTHLFLIENGGLEELRIVNIGRHDLYEAMAEVLHLHYIGSAVKLFTRSGFDSSELAPKLGGLFGSAIQSVLDETGWAPASVHLTGLLRAQSWFQEAVLQALNIKEFKVDQSLLPFEIDESVGTLSSMDVEILAKIFTSLTSDEDFSWHNDYLSCLSKSSSIPRREPSGSNPPFPTAHPDRTPEVVLRPVETSPDPVVEEIAPPEPIPYAPPPQPAPVPAPAPQPVVHEHRPSPQTSTAPKQVEAIPAHLLSDIEEYEGEFEDLDDYGGGTGRLLIKLGLFLLSIIVVVVLVIIVFFPKASEKYLGFRPPHINYEDADSSRPGVPMPTNVNGQASSVLLTDADVASGVQDLRTQREARAFGGLYMVTNPIGATVIVGGMEPQFSPIKMPNIAPGTYDIVISKTGYQTRILTVTIKAKEVFKTETINLQRLP